MTLLKDKLKDSVLTLTGELSATQIDTLVSQKVKEYSKKVKLDGFREGHVPEKVILERFGEGLRQEVLIDGVNQDFQEFNQGKKYRLASEPKVDFGQPDKKGTIDYTITAEVLQRIEKLEDLSKIKLTQKVAEVEDSEVEESLSKLAAGQAELFEIEEDRALQNGDVAVIDFEGFLDGVPFEGGKGENFDLELGSSSFIAGFEEGLVGKRKGDVELALHFPKEYHAENLAGKPVVFKVSVKTIKAKRLPEQDDTWAQKLGRKDLADLKSYVKELLEGQHTARSNALMQEELLNELASRTKMDLPESMVEKEVEAIEKSHNHGDQKPDEKHLKEIRKDAERRIKLGLVISQYGEELKVEVKEDDLQKAIMQEAVRYPGHEQEVFKYYQENKDAMGNMQMRVYESKTLEAMIAQCQKKEKKVSLKELESK